MSELSFLWRTSFFSLTTLPLRLDRENPWTIVLKYCDQAKDTISTYRCVQSVRSRWSAFTYGTMSKLSANFPSSTFAVREAKDNDQSSWWWPRADPPPDFSRDDPFSLAQRVDGSSNPQGGGGCFEGYCHQATCSFQGGEGFKEGRTSVADAARSATMLDCTPFMYIDVCSPWGDLSQQVIQLRGYLTAPVSSAIQWGSERAFALWPTIHCCRNHCSS